MEFIKLGSIWGSFVITFILMACHYLSPLIKKIPHLNSRKIISFSGGIAVAYVFLHMLPELVEGNSSIGKLLLQTKSLTALLDLGIFIIALFGFNIYFGLEVLAARVKLSHRSSIKNVYFLHLMMYGIYNFLITYTMPLRVQSGIPYAIMFTFVIGFHFIFVDRNFNQNFHRYFSTSGRLFLLSALFFGWLITALTNPMNIVLVSFMIAFLSGSVLYTVFREELPTTKKSSFIMFTAGILLLSIILILMNLIKT